MCEVKYLWIFWAKKNAVNANLILNKYNPIQTLDTLIGFAFNLRLSCRLQLHFQQCITTFSIQEQIFVKK